MRGHGEGELPDKSLGFYEKLEKERPDPDGACFCVCELGDDAYADFCGAGSLRRRVFSRPTAARWAAEDRNS